MSLGLGFCPDSDLDVFESTKDVTLFVRKLILRVLHHKTDSNPPCTSALMNLTLTECRELKSLLLSDSQTCPSSLTPLIEAHEALDGIVNIPPNEEPNPLTPLTLDFKIKSTVFPSLSLNKNALLFLKLVTGELSNMEKTPPMFPNITKAQLQALRQLKTYDHLVIKEADKGGCTVVLDRSHYKQICLDPLDNKDWYLPISLEQIDQFTVDFYSLVDAAWDNNTIDKRIRDYIKTPFPKILTFYTLPKIHKTGKFTGRPIISGSGSLAESARVWWIGL